MSDDMIWVRTDPSTDGTTYVVTVDFDDDNSRVITPDQAGPYAKAVLAAAQRAEYDAAVFDQLRGLDLPVPTVGQLIVDLRADRAPIDQEPTAPMRLEPGVNAEGTAFIAIHIDDKQIGQWTVDDARSHAETVVEAVEAADLDAGYYRALTGMVGLDQSRARKVIAQLAEFR